MSKSLKQQTYLLIILGAPKSGIKVFSDCTRILGFAPLEDQKLPGPESINQLLLQDLGITPYTPALPRDWIKSRAAQKAKDRINRLTAATLPLSEQDIPDKSQVNRPGSNLKPKTYNLKHTTFISDILLSRTLPIWKEALAEHNVSYQCLHIIRHPWEVAMSLNQNAGVDFQTAHIAWLSYVREALRHCPDQTVITFDQLLADPVSTINNALGSFLTSDLCLPRETFTQCNTRSVLQSKVTPGNPKDLPKGFNWGPLTSGLLDFVQPSLKHHHISDLPEADREAYRPFARLYDQILYIQHSSSAQISENQRPATSCSSESDLIDSLLKTLAQHDRSTDSSRYNQSGTTDNWSLTTDIRQATTGLYATITFPSSNAQGEASKRIPLIENQWQKISLSVPEPELLRDKPIIINPLNTNGSVIISNIHLINRSKEEILWEAKSSQEFDLFEVSGTALRLPDVTYLKILIMGNEPFMKFPVILTNHYPLKLVIWIKTSRYQQEIRTVMSYLGIEDWNYCTGKTNRKLTLVYSTDENYWTHLFISLMSILEKMPRHNINIFILSNKVNDFFFSNISFLKKYNKNIDIKFVPINSKIFEDVKVSHHFTQATYYRIILGEVLPKDISRILYLDCDMIALSSINTLFHINMNGSVLFAVPTFGSENAERMKFPVGSLYFNSGMMLIDLDKWRHENIIENSFEFMRKNIESLLWADQDILNAVLRGKWKPLSPAFNFQHKHVQSWEKGGIDIDPVIVHFTGKLKPWHESSRHPFKPHYWNYLLNSPYREILKLSNKNDPFDPKLSLPGLIRIT